MSLSTKLDSPVGCAAFFKQSLNGIVQGLQDLTLNPEVVTQHSLGTQGSYLCGPYFALKRSCPLSIEQETRMQQIFLLSHCDRVVPQMKLTGLSRSHFGMPSHLEDAAVFVVQDLSMYVFQSILRNISPAWSAKQTSCMGQSVLQKLSSIKELYVRHQLPKDLFAFQDTEGLTDKERTLYLEYVRTWFRVTYKNKNMSVTYGFLLKFYALGEESALQSLDHEQQKNLRKFFKLPW